MELTELCSLLMTPQRVEALKAVVTDKKVKRIKFDGLVGSSLAVVFSRLPKRVTPYLVVANDADEAGYMYNDLCRVIGDNAVLYFPSGYKRDIKYGQKDAPNEILRTDVLTTLAQPTPEGLFIITSPAALAERVAPREEMDDATLRVQTGVEYDLMLLVKRLEERGFRRKDYVYEPGEFALRGSILDIFSFSSEYPYRLDFFGDEVDSIRTFEVQTQLSREVMQEVAIVPECCGGNVGRKATPLVPFTDFLPADTIIVARNLPFVSQKVQQYYDEGFSRQAIAEREAESRATSEMELEAIRQQLRADFMLVEGSEIDNGLQK